MLLSEILKEMGIEPNFVSNEISFETMALAATELPNPFLTFLDTEKYIGTLTENAAVVLTTSQLAPLIMEKGKSTYVTEQPRLLFFAIHNFLASSMLYPRTKYKTQIGKNCTISPLAVIAENNVIIGDDVIIEEFAVVRENVVIGDHGILRAGAIVGGMGFEFKRGDGKIASVDHLGGVVLGSHVEIQYHTCIDRAVYPWDNTIIGDYCKLDNLVHIGHAVKLAPRVMVVAHSGVGGRTEVDEDSWIGFGAVLKNGLHIGKNARANMGAVVTKDIPDGEAVSGNFAIAHNRFIAKMKEM